MAKLTAKQEVFVREYLVDLDGTKAAIRAGYSKKTAYSIASENLRKPEVAEAVQAGMDERAKRLGVNAHRVLEEISAVAFVPLKLKDKVAKAEEGEIDLAVVTVTEKLKALELLGKHLKLFTDKVEHSVDKTLEQLLTEATKQEGK